MWWQNEWEDHRQRKDRLRDNTSGRKSSTYPRSLSSVIKNRHWVAPDIVLERHDMQNVVDVFLILYHTLFFVQILLKSLLCCICQISSSSKRISLFILIPPSRMSLISCVLCATPVQMCSCCASALSVPPPSRTFRRNGSRRSGDMHPLYPSSSLGHSVTSEKMSRWNIYWCRENVKKLQYARQSDAFILTKFKPLALKILNHNLTHLTHVFYSLFHNRHFWLPLEKKHTCYWSH